jgi:NAD(P)-dependent dehydrogenase (short-subunit alcohol dehydrogenase family)
VPRPVAVITGAARGIGLESARRLSETHRVALLDRDATGVEAAAKRIGGDAVWAACDITRPDSVAAAVADVVERCGGIDVAIANAGIATAGGMRHLDPDVLATQLDVNLVGSWRFVHACLPHVIARRGYVLGVASAAAIVAPTGIGFYASSKAGFEHLLNVLRIEVSHLGVDVGIAFFSWIDTDMVRGAETHQPAFAKLRADLRGPAGRTLPVSAAGEAIADAVAHRRRTVVAPGFVRVAYALRGLIGPLVDRDGRRRAPRVDRATAEMVAERGAYAAALRPGDLDARTTAPARGR